MHTIVAARGRVHGSRAWPARVHDLPLHTELHVRTWHSELVPNSKRKSHRRILIAVVSIHSTMAGMRAVMLSSDCVERQVFAATHGTSCRYQIQWPRLRRRCTMQMMESTWYWYHGIIVPSRLQ